MRSNTSANICRLTRDKNVIKFIKTDINFLSLKAFM